MDNRHIDDMPEVRALRALGFEPRESNQEELDSEHRAHWDRLHQAAGLPPREDLPVPPPPVEIPPRPILEVMARAVHQCDISYTAALGKPYADVPTREHLDGIIGVLLGFVKRPEMTPEELFVLTQSLRPEEERQFYEELSEPERYAYTMILKAVRLAWSLAGVYL